MKETPQRRPPWPGVLLVAGGLAFCYWVYQSTGELKPDRQDIYWLYSAAAQALAAFTGLLVTGYALVLSQLSERDKADESIRTITAQLRRQYYGLLKSLGIISAIAILGSLVILYLNGMGHWSLRYIHPVVLFLVGASVAMGVWFVFNIVNPDAISATASRQLRESPALQADAPTPPNAPGVLEQYKTEADFLEAAAAIEKKVWEAYGKLGSIVLEPGSDLHSLSYAVRALHQEGKISTTLRQMLLDFIPIRNALAHGGRLDDDPRLVSLLTAIRHQLDFEVGGQAGSGA